MQRKPYHLSYFPLSFLFSNTHIADVQQEHTAEYHPSSSVLLTPSITLTPLILCTTYSSDHSTLIPALPLSLLPLQSFLAVMNVPLVL